MTEHEKDIPENSPQDDRSAVEASAVGYKKPFPKRAEAEMRSLIQRCVGWLRDGYPAGVPSRDVLPLMTLLRRRLTDDDVQRIVNELVESGITLDSARTRRIEGGVAIIDLTDEVPTFEDLDRVAQALAVAGCTETWDDSPN